MPSSIRFAKLGVPTTVTKECVIQMLYTFMLLWPRVYGSCFPAKRPIRNGIFEYKIQKQF